MQCKKSFYIPFAHYMICTSFGYTLDLIQIKQLNELRIILLLLIKNELL